MTRIAWVIIAVIAGIAAHGTVSLTNVGASLAGTALFLAVSLTVGRRLVARIIRWSNDNMTIEVPVITAILLIMLVMALSTELIGVHTALGAFVAGMLVGQSPILTEHIEGELRGFIIAFFSPVFFAVAGLGMDLRTLFDPRCCCSRSPSSSLPASESSSARLLEAGWAASPAPNRWRSQRGSTPAARPRSSSPASDCRWGC